WALRDVSLEVRPGEFLALIGRSGSGKTTLLNIMAGLDRPTSGEVELNGQRLDTMSEGDLTDLRRRELGFIFQSFGLLPLLSAQENVELPLRIAGYGHRERSRRAAEMLDLVGLSRRANHRPYELSGGEQQRVAIARAIATEPSLILADEPTGELDSATATIVFGLLRDIARTQGLTVVACTHDRLVMELADRVEELADGRLVTGEHREVWKHVQSKERSPFAAMAPGTQEDGERELSSLIGADKRVFAGTRPRGDELDGAVADADHEDEAGQEPETDVSRWARPRRQ
ncbi:MAG: ABC transporter ATP-binding protein, partial [Hyphomicrobiales bacterium]